MKLFIVLASHDNAAQLNEYWLRLYRMDKMPEGALEDTIQAEVIGTKLIAPGLGEYNPFIVRSVSNANSASIEFIAHGDRNKDRYLLSLPEEQASLPNDNHVYAEITPSMLKDFFLTIASDGHGNFKFARLTLFCCTSLQFAEKLSESMPTIKIKAFDQDIKLLDKAIAKNVNGEIVAPHVFIAGEAKREYIQLYDNEEKAEIVRAEAEKLVLRAETRAKQIAESQPDGLLNSMIQAQLQEGLFSQAPSSSSSTRSSTQPTSSSTSSNSSSSKIPNRK